MKFWIALLACLLTASATACMVSSPIPESPLPQENPSSTCSPAIPKPPISELSAVSSEASSSSEPPRIILNNQQIALGEALILRAENVQGLEVTAQTDLPFQPTFYPDDDVMLAFLPVSYTTPIGSYSLTVQAGEQTFHYTIAVEDREFIVQNLTVDAQTTANTAENEKANAEWASKIEPLKKISEPEKYWDDVFVQPVEGSITTEFGVIRYTNGSKNATRHGGIDIAAAQGTPIVAANGAKVLFSDFLQLTGNTVVLEHGMGLKSFYYHMDSLAVQEGDVVEKGDMVGTVGSTGFSTGPHLHYALLVNNVFINPWTAFESGMG